MVYRILADLVLVLHAAIVAFVVMGQLLVIAGLVLRWRWVRNFWFRAAHLLAIVVVVVQSWAGVPCPLTVLENVLRERSGGAAYPGGGFIAYWMHELLFYEAEPWVFTLCYSLFGLTVLACFLIGPPRNPWRSKAPEPIAPVGT